jgi:hypothetical protein
MTGDWLYMAPVARLSGGDGNAPPQKQTAATAIIRNGLAGIAISHVRFGDAPSSRGRCS